MAARAIFPFLALFCLFSCKTAYKSGQTPDDIYLAESRPEGSVIFVSGFEDDLSSADPAFRMRCRDRRWRQFFYDDPFNSPYSWQHCYHCYGNGFNYYSFPNSFPGPILSSPIKNNTPRTTSLEAYGLQPVQVTTNIKTRETKTLSGRDSYNNSNNNNIINRSQTSPTGSGRTYAPSGGAGRTSGSGRIFSGSAGN